MVFFTFGFHFYLVSLHLASVFFSMFFQVHLINIHLRSFLCLLFLASHHDTFFSLHSFSSKMGFHVTYVILCLLILHLNAFQSNRILRFSPFLSSLSSAFSPGMTASLSPWLLIFSLQRPHLVTSNYEPLTFF